MIDKIMMYAIAGLLILLVIFGVYHFSRVAILKLQVTELEVKVAERDKDILVLKSSLDMTIKANGELELAIKTQNDQVAKWI